MEMKTVFVHVTTDISKKDLEQDDQSIPGLYEVTLDGDTPDSVLANAALDGFHGSFGISNLDDFLIVVRKSSEPDSESIEQADEFNNGDFEGQVNSVQFIHSFDVCDIPSPLRPERSLRDDAPSP